MTRSNARFASHLIGAETERQLYSGTKKNSPVRKKRSRNPPPVDEVNWRSSGENIATKMLPAASTANGSNLFDNIDRLLSLVNHDAAINKAKASMIQSSGVNIANMDDSPLKNGNAFRLMIMNESTPRN